MSVLQTVEDKSYVMSVACNDCGRYFAKIKNILLLPLVILSSFLVVINGYDGKNNEWIQFLNMSLNGFNKTIDTFQNFWIVALPIQIVIPSIFRENQFHSTNSLSCPLPASRSEIECSKRLALLGLRSK